MLRIQSHGRGVTLNRIPLSNWKTFPNIKIIISQWSHLGQFIVICKHNVVTRNILLLRFSLLYTTEDIAGWRCRQWYNKKMKMKTCLNEHRKEIEIKLVIFTEFLLWMAFKTYFWQLRSNVVSNVAKNDKIKAFKFESKSSLVNMTCCHSDKIQVIIEIDLWRSFHFDLIDLRGSWTWTQNMTRLILIKNSTWDFIAVNWLVNDSTKILCRVHNSIATDLFFQWFQLHSTKHTRYSVHFIARAIKIFWIDNVRFGRVK